MTDVAVAATVTDAVLAALRAIPNPSGGTIHVGDAVKPDSPAKPPLSFYPYAIVYAGVVDTNGTLVAPHEDAIHRVQVICVGRDRLGAEWLRDQCRQILLDKTALAIDGAVVVWTESAGEPSVTRDDDLSPPVFSAVIVVNLKVTPTGAGS